jgi:uncharacterized membrane protein YhhN
MPFFFFAGIVLAIADWIAVAREAFSVRWITKPGALLSLLLWFTTSTPASSNPQITWFTLALCFSLVGDIFLLMEGHQLIKGGLAFILAHIAFIVAYNTPLQMPLAFLAVFLLNIIPTFIVYRKILKEIRAAGDKDLAIGVSLYALALTSMTSTAFSTLFRPNWPAIASWPTALGAVLFYISDLLLFSNHFLKTKHRTNVLTMVTYHIAQFSLAYGYLWFLYR